MEEIHEFISLFGKTADPEPGRQGRDRKQNTAFSEHIYTLPQYFLALKRQR
jgi:hypothetical protein